MGKSLDHIHRRSGTFLYTRVQERAVSFFYFYFYYHIILITRALHGGGMMAHT